MMETGHPRRTAPRAAPSHVDGGYGPDEPSHAPPARGAPHAPDCSTSDADPSGRAETPGDLEYASWLRVLRQQRA
jgi:hypothetical protein